MARRQVFVVRAARASTAPAVGGMAMRPRYSSCLRFLPGCLPVCHEDTAQWEHGTSGRITPPVVGDEAVEDPCQSYGKHQIVPVLGVGGVGVDENPG